MDCAVIVIQLVYLLLGGLFNITNTNVQATQDGSQTQLSVWILGAVSNVTASDAAACQTSSTSG